MYCCIDVLYFRIAFRRGGICGREGYPLKLWLCQYQSDYECSLLCLYFEVYVSFVGVGLLRKIKMFGKIPFKISLKMKFVIKGDSVTYTEGVSSSKLL